MARTTLLKRHFQMSRQDDPNCHDGAGALDWTIVLKKGELPGSCLRFMHDDVLPVGASMGEHRHSDSEEYYYIISGRGRATLDGQEFDVGPGDLMGVYPGGAHGLANTSDEPMRLLAVCVSAGAGQTC